MPERVRLRRTKGWQLPANTIVVSRPSRWGNPIKVEGDAVRLLCAWQALDAESRANRHRIARQLFAHYLAGFPGPLPDVVAAALPMPLPMPPTIDEIRGALAGRNLACWCPPELACHAEVLLAIANGDRWIEPQESGR